MPSAAPRPCTIHGCRALVTGGSRCEKHQRPAWKRKPEDEGKTTTERGYGRLWQRKRVAVLMREPLCRMCKEEGRVTMATEVDHVIPKARGGSDSDSNLQSICEDCHKAKTANEGKR